MNVADIKLLVGSTRERLDRAWARWLDANGSAPEPLDLPARWHRYCGPEHPVRLEAIRLLVEGQGIPDMEMRVAVRLGLTRSTVVRWRREAGIPGRHPARPRRTPTEEQRQEAIRLMFEEGASIRQTAKLVGVSEGTVMKWRRRRRLEDMDEAEKGVHRRAEGVSREAGDDPRSRGDGGR